MAVRFHIILAALLVSQIASGQIKIVPQERLMEVSSPRHCADSAFLQFDRTACNIRMEESDAPDTLVFNVTNTGKENILISRIVSTCSCVSARCGTRVLTPGGSTDITAIYNPKGHPGSFVRKIFIYTGENRMPAATLKINAAVGEGGSPAKELIKKYFKESK
ncbi:MAG: DUF1573 domain-containing protein [Candidatus Cryptobacteroides sp.]